MEEYSIDVEEPLLDEINAIEAYREGKKKCEIELLKLEDILPDA